MRGRGPTATELRAQIAAEAAPAALAGPGSWSNPRIRRDGVATRATSVHLPIDLAEELEAMRFKTNRRLSDLIAEGMRQWLKNGGARP